jgi:hypothetical protein
MQPQFMYGQRESCLGDERDPTSTFLYCARNVGAYKALCQGDADLKELYGRLNEDGFEVGAWAGIDDRERNKSLVAVVEESHQGFVSLGLYQVPIKVCVSWAEDELRELFEGWLKQTVEFGGDTAVAIFEVLRHMWVGPHEADELVAMMHTVELSDDDDNPVMTFTLASITPDGPLLLARRAGGDLATLSTLGDLTSSLLVAGEAS